ncbi:transcriptional regulator [Psychromonas sp. psych-6C06]|uniref:EAL domain-containing protein n=1 Tax=Psychromonas sp. psych-6C06 TaxID=2058089 RepID=UPI000C34D6EA|nr:EAL domain-containing protein [Psychromonas sp. psych-6C06]PKF62967.1 transcriptional regulator [Psychromonas sp. psych-6C06]
MKFTDKFTFITTTVVLSCIALVLIGGFFSLRSLSLKFHENRIDGVVQVIEAQLDKHAQKKQFDVWLPDLLDASGIVRLQIQRDDLVLFQNYYESRDFFPDHLLLEYQYKLARYPSVTLVIHTRRPYDSLTFSAGPLLGVSAAILISLLLLGFAIRWIKKQFRGAELLEKRAKYILQNNPTARIAEPGEWPMSASKALDMLNQKLEESKKERSYFDAHIRGQAFLDETTGIGNRLAFENQLDATSFDVAILSSALLLIKFSELDAIEESYCKDKRNALLLQITELLIEFSSRYTDPFYGRIDKSEFALILPQMSYEETEVAAKQLTKLLLQLQLPEDFSIDDFFYIGVVNFSYGDKPLVIMEDLNRASLVAKHQVMSGWYLAEQEVKHSSLIKGTVRWRSLLERVLEKDSLLLYRQQLMLRDSMSELYSELWPRIIGYDEEVIDAGVFLPMAEKCGLQQRFDLLMLEKILALLVMRGEMSKPIAINLSSGILMDRERMKWFIFELMQLSKPIRRNLVVEVSEHLLVDSYYPLRNALISLQKVGCKIAIDNVGKSIVNTGYILDFSIDYLKLHTGLVRDINLRKTNQMALQSLMASCINSPTKVIAVGIESNEEWKCLLKLGIYAGQGTLFSTAQPMPI